MAMMVGGCFVALLLTVLAIAACPMPRKDEHDEFCLVACHHIAASSEGPNSKTQGQKDS